MEDPDEANEGPLPEGEEADENAENMPQGEDEGEDEEYYEDEPEEGAFLTADHALLRRFQNALQKQLEAEHEKIDLQLREKEEDLKKIKKDREETGVSLYGLQHQLAKIQMVYERTQDNLNIVQKYRTEAETRREELRKEFDQKKQEVEEQNKRVLKAQEELNQLNRTLKQVEEYNQQMKSEIAVTRRTTYTGDQNVYLLEKQKKKQDLLIDQLSEEIQQLSEQYTLYYAQLISQQEETKAARETLKEAGVEIENIVNQKNMMLEDWQKTLLGMQRRDKALEAIKDLLKAKGSNIVQINSELAGLKSKLNQEHDHSQELTAEREKIKLENRGIERKNEEHKLNQDKLEGQMGILKNSIAATENEIRRLDIESGNIVDQINVINFNIGKVSRDTKDLMEQIMSHLSEETTLEKQSADLQKQAKSTYSEIFEKEVEMQNTENEIGRVKIDVLNTTNQNGLLQNKLKELMKELEDKSKKEEDEENKIKKNSEEIEKKQKLVDDLNRDLGKYTSNSQNEDVGPLENQIHNLKKGDAEKEAECVLLRSEWIKKETGFLTNMRESKDLEKMFDLQKNEQIILNQKKMRLETNSRIEKKTIGQLEIALKNLGNDMKKLNGLFSKHNEKKNTLEDENENMESEFIQRLKELENESLKLEAQIQELKDEKAEILTEIVEAEKQILLWERKIQLQKEMLRAVDPEIGQSEIKNMKKEIHNMERRYEELKRKQEEFIKEIERSVNKRETIQLKYLPQLDRAEKTVKGGKATGGKMTRQIANLKITLKHTTENAMQLDKNIEEKLRQLENVNGEIETATETALAFEEDVNNSQVGVLTKRIMKEHNLFQILKNQHMGLKFDQIATGKFKPTLKEESLRKAFDDQKASNEAIEKVLIDFRDQNPQMESLISQLLDWQ